MMGDAVKGNWITLVEYAMKRCVSLSTLRRRIKKKSIVFKLEKGRYLLLDDDSPAETSRDALMSRADQLESDLKKAQEEIAELKTLIALYEEKYPH